MMTDKNQDEERKKQMKSCKFMRRLNANIKKTNPCKKTPTTILHSYAHSSIPTQAAHMVMFIDVSLKKHTGVNVNIS